MIKTCFRYSVGMAVLSEKLMAQIHSATIHKGFAVILAPKWPLKHGDLLCFGIQRQLCSGGGIEAAFKDLLGALMVSGPYKHPVKHSSINNGESRLGLTVFSKT